MGSVGTTRTVGNTIQFPASRVQSPNTATSMIDNENGWKYPGIDQRITQLEEAFKRQRSINTINTIARELRVQDELISNEIKRLHDGTADMPGSESALLTYRRRVRQLMKKARF